MSYRATALVLFSFLVGIAIPPVLTTSIAQTGPGGVGDSTASTNNSDRLTVWLRSDVGVTVATGSESLYEDTEVDLWADQSGEGHDFDDEGYGNAEKKRRPHYKTDTLNGHPVLRFNTAGESKKDVLTNSESTVTDILKGDHTVFVVSATREEPTGSNNFWYQFRFPNANSSENMGYPGTSEGKVKVDKNGTGPDINLPSPITDYQIFSSVSDNAADTKEDLAVDGNVLETKSSSATSGANRLELGIKGTAAKVNFAEFIVFRTALNTAQRRLVTNYLSEKYGLSLPSDDYYRFGSSHPSEIVGIGKAAPTTGAAPDGEHTASTSSPLTIKEAADRSLQDGEFVMIGHDGSAAHFTTRERPNGKTTVQKTEREWRAEVTGTSQKTVDVEVDYEALSLPNDYNDRALYVDADGDFTNGATYYDLDHQSGSTYEASGVTISDGDYVTVAAVQRVVNFTTTSRSRRENTSAPDMQVQMELNFAHDSDITINLRDDGDLDGSGQLEDGGATNADGPNGNGNYEADDGSGLDTRGDFDGDYRLNRSSKTIRSGKTSATVDIKLDDDAISSTAPYEQTEMFEVTIGSISGAATQGSKNRFIGRIVDDDHPNKIAFSDPDDTDGRNKTSSSYNPSSQSETSTTLVYEVAVPDGKSGLTGPATEVTYEVTGGSATADADFKLVDGKDGTRVSATEGIVTIPDDDQYGQFEIQLLKDDTYEANETVKLKLTAAQGGTLDGNDKTNHTLTITGDDPKPSVSFTSDLFKDREDSDAGLDVSLSEPVEVDVDVTFEDAGTGSAVSGGTDYTFPDSPTLTIPAGNTDGTLTFSVNDDGKKESSETINVDIAGASNATVGARETSTYTIVDNDVIGSVGPGGVGNRSSIAFWGEPDDLGLSDGTGVNPWPDSSGNDNDATEVTSEDFDKSLTSDPGAFVSSGPNGRSAIAFSKSDHFYNVNAADMRSLPDVDHTLFGVSTIDTDGGNPDGLLEIKTSNGNYRRSFGYSNDKAVRVSQYDGDNGSVVQLTHNPSTTGTLDESYHLLSSEVEGDTLDLWYNGESETRTVINPTGTGTDPIIGYNRGTQRKFYGSLAALIAYDAALNKAQRHIVHNYLSAKYGVGLDDNDLYAGDADSNGDYDFGVIGIGRDGGSAIEFLHSRAQDHGVTLTAETVENGEYVLLGTTAEVPSTKQVNYDGTDGVAGLTARPDSVWFADVTGGSVSFDLAFDLQSLGFQSRSRTDDGYVLLAADASSCRPDNNDCSWADAGGSVAVNGDVVTFSDVDLSSGSHYLSLGTTDLGTSPLFSRTALRIVGTDGNEGSAADATLGGDAGWRLIGPPVTNSTVRDLSSGARDPFVLTDLPLGHMFYEWDDTIDNRSGPDGAWTPLTQYSTAFDNGRGHLLFLFDDTEAPLDPGLTLDVESKKVPTGDQSVSSLNEDARYHVLANPYNSPFDLTSLSESGTSLGSGNTDFQTTVQIWDGGTTSGNDQSQAGSYLDVPVNTTANSGADRMAPDGDLLSAWQGFLVERTSPGTGATSLTFNYDGKTTGQRSIIGSKTRDPDPSDFARLGFKLTVTNDRGRQIARDAAATLHFGKRATPVWDAFDASKLIPLSKRYAIIGPVGRIRSDSVAMKAVESRPMPGRSDTVVPMRLSRSGGVTGTARLETDGWTGVPDHWSVTLIDTKGTSAPDDDKRTEISPESGYTFTLEETSKTLSEASGDRGAPHTTDRLSPARLRRVERKPRPNGADHRKNTATSQQSSARFRVRVEPNRSPLPVEMAEMNAKVENRRITLTWTTASETNNAGFHVEHNRLPPGDTTTTHASKQWERLHFVAGAGTASTPRSYSYETERLGYGRHVFRLRQVDTDGKTATTDPVEADVLLQTSYAVTPPYPNPAQQQAALEVTVRDKQHLTIQVYDLLGRRIQTVCSRSIPAQETTRFTIPTERLSSGPYFVRIRGDQFATTTRLTVVK